MSATMRAPARQGQQRQQRPRPSGAGRGALPAFLLAVALLPFLPLFMPRDGYTVAPLAPPAATPPARPPAVITHTVRYDRYSLLLDNRRVVLFGGEYQFWRTPSPERWPVVLAEMRAAGLNTVSVGVSWQYHSPAPGVFDFSGARDLRTRATIT